MQERKKGLLLNANIQESRVFSAQGSHSKRYRHDRLHWHTTFMPIPKELDPVRYKKIRKLIGMDSAEVDRFFYIDSFTHFDRFSFKNQNNMNPTLSFVTKPNTVHKMFSPEKLVFMIELLVLNINNRDNLIYKDNLSTTIVDH